MKIQTKDNKLLGVGDVVRIAREGMPLVHAQIVRVFKDNHAECFVAALSRSFIVDGDYLISKS